MNNLEQVVTAMPAALKLHLADKLPAPGPGHSAAPAADSSGFDELKKRGDVHPDDPPQNPPTSGGGDGSLQALGPILVRTFVWGFHLEIPHDTLTMILGSADVVGTVMSILAPATGPAAPFLAGAATFISVATGVCRLADANGRGIFLSMLWVAPGVFVPTPVT